MAVKYIERVVLPTGENTWAAVHWNISMLSKADERVMKERSNQILFSNSSYIVNVLYHTASNLDPKNAAGGSAARSAAGTPVSGCTALRLRKW